MQSFDKNSFTGYRGDAIMGKNSRWSTAAIFVDGLEPNKGRHN